MAAEIIFGAGEIDVDGESAGVLQEYQFNMDGDAIELFGSSEFAVDVASGKKKLGVTFKNGELGLGLLAKLLGGSVSSAGSYTYSNQTMGSVSPFSVVWTCTYLGQDYTLTFHACIFKKWSLQGGNDKHGIVDGELAAMQDATGKVFTFAKAAAA